MGSRRGSGWLAAASVLLAVAAAPASANEGFELNASTPFRIVTGVPHGIAVDQANRRIYLAIVTSEPNTGAPGQIVRFESNLTPAGTFSAGTKPFYTGVAVNPLTQGFYAAQALLHTPFGSFGTPRMDVFTSAGTAGSPFSLSDNGTLPQIAVDSSGLVYYPNAATNSVQVFNAVGQLQKEIGCSGCPGGSFDTPVSVAFNSVGELYVVDLSPDRVVKLAPSGGSYVFASTLQSGLGAAAVAVDPSTDDVFVGDLPSGSNYHIVAYHSSGTKFDDFGAGLFTNPDAQFGARIAVQIAVDATNHRLYVGELNKFYIFDKVTSKLPTAEVKPASPVGQLTATLRADVDANGHAAFECEFEFTDDADFDANDFANADTAQCPELPKGADATALSAKITGLAPVTEYHYRVTTTTYAGSATSDPATFETLPVMPATVTTKSPTSVVETSASLTGTVNPHGGSISSCQFKYGTTVSYGTTTSCVGLPGPVSEDVAVTRKVLKLSPGTTYHYKLVVTGNAGTVEGEDVKFTTASPPPPPQDPVQPPASGDPPAAAVPPVSVAPTRPPPLRCRKGFRKKKVRGRLKCVRLPCKRNVKPKRVQRKASCPKPKRASRRR